MTGPRRRERHSPIGEQIHLMETIDQWPNAEQTRNPSTSSTVTVPRA